MKVLSSLLQARTSRANPGSETSGDIPPPSSLAQVDQLCQQGAFSGAIQGLISGSRLHGLKGGMAGLAGGAVGGLVGSQVGFRLQSFPLAVAAGSSSGALTSASLALALASLTGSPLVSADLAALGLMGGLTGLVGTLGGARRALTRDSLYGGYSLGLVASPANPLVALAAAGGAGLGARCPGTWPRLAASGLAGAGLGALASLPYLVAGHPEAQAALWQGLQTGAAAAAGGSLLGPPVRQATRNLQDDLVGHINERLDPWLQQHPLGTAGKMAAGGALGMLSLGSLGLLAPVLGAPLAPALSLTAASGGLVGSWQVARALEQRERAELSQRYLRAYAPAGPAIREVLEEVGRQIRISREPEEHEQAEPILANPQSVEKKPYPRDLSGAPVPARLRDGQSSPRQ